MKFNITLKNVLITCLIVSGALFISGCADKQARQDAAFAQETAVAAQACCDANQERITRMYQKLMTK